MKVITESFLRETFRKEIPETFRLEKGQIMTPSARQLLNEKRVKVVTGKEEAAVNVPKKADTALTPTPAVHKYVAAGDGGMFENKPGHMTELHGNRLVQKDHPRIIFRGKMDSLQSRIVMIQFKLHEAGAEKLVKDLGDILELSDAVIRADVGNETLLNNNIIGLSDEEIKKQLSDPEKHFGTGPIKPGFDMGRIILSLNMLRTSIRETEILAVKAFRSEFEIEKPDIIHALNKMSNAVSIIMLREKAGKYK